MSVIVKQRFVWCALALVVVLSLASTGQASAQQATDFSGWLPVEEGHPLWFVFQVGWVEKDVVSSVSVAANAKPGNYTSIQMYTAGNWSYWGYHDPKDWFGVTSASGIGGPPGAANSHRDATLSMWRRAARPR